VTDLAGKLWQESNDKTSQMMNADMGSKILVTGAAGFIGSHVARHLVAAGHEVLAVDDLSGGFLENVPAGATFVHGSVSDERFVLRLFEEHRFDYVFHLAAYAAEGLSHFIRGFNYTNNLLGSTYLINAAVNAGCVKCFVFTSSIAVYGRNQLPMTEETTPLPEDPYGISKYAVELDLRAAHEMFGLNSVIFRPHNVYGEGQNLGDPYRNVVGIFMNQIMQGKNLTVFGDGLQTRAFSYIDDVALPIAASIARPKSWNQVFNVGADRPYTILELAKVVGRAFGADPIIHHLTARNEVVDAYSSHEKVHQHFGDLLTNLDLENGISRMVGWAKKAGPRVGSKFGRIEVEKNMPESWRRLV